MDLITPFFPSLSNGLYANTGTKLNRVDKVIVPTPEQQAHTNGKLARQDQIRKRTVQRTHCGGHREYLSLSVLEATPGGRQEHYVGLQSNSEWVLAKDMKSSWQFGCPVQADME